MTSKQIIMVFNDKLECKKKYIKGIHDTGFNFKMKFAQVDII